MPVWDGRFGGTGTFAGLWNRHSCLCGTGVEDPRRIRAAPALHPGFRLSPPS